MYLIADSSFADTLALLWTIAKVAIGVGFVIFVHELGHFLVAKACGVKCEKFYVGFDVPIRIGPIRFPRTLGKVQWGETEYGIGIIPLGGYVKMLGQDDNPANAQREAERIRTSQDEGEEEALDPRSFPAKSVPQRMMIISAGVIMNLIFAVVFAAVAYRMGVTYEPCEIGSTSPGSPAWQIGMEPSSKILQIGSKGDPNEFLRFDWDLQQGIATAGLGDSVKPLPLLIRRPGTREPEWIELVPSTRLQELEMTRFVTIGIRSMSSTTLADERPVVPYLAAGDAEPPLEGGDRIVGADGQLFDTSMANHRGELPALELENYLARNADREITLMVDRPTGDGKFERREVRLPPNRMRHLGLVMTAGPIVGVQAGSPAAQAGIQAGDLLMQINGRPIGDPLRLPQRMFELAGEEVTLTVRRGAGDEAQMIDIPVTPVRERRFGAAYLPAARVGVDALGIAYDVIAEVNEVLPGTPADDNGIEPGDVVVSAKFEFREEDQERARELFGPGVNDSIEFTDQLTNWAYVHGLLQEMLPGTRLKLTLRRGESHQTVLLEPVEAEDWFYTARGLRTVELRRLHTAESWMQAWKLGLLETRNKVTEVGTILWKLVSGKLSPKNLGGPAMIAYVAGSEAKQGIPRLLLFLTLLSANLAILNFLPVPALDGGHMVFLAWEAVTGRPVDERFQTTLTLIGVACLLGLMIFVIVNDATTLSRLF